MSESLITFTEAARRLGIQRNRVSAAIQVLEIPVFSTEWNANIKLIEASSLELLREKFAAKPKARATA